jgi:Arc/MetJ family transcription regulator
MKTTIDIPEKELQDAMELTGARSKREAVVTALTEFNRAGVWSAWPKSSVRSTGL